MKQEDVIQWFLQLSPPQQIRVVIEIAHYLTISARDTYVPLSYEIAQPRELRGVNELQHQLLGHLTKLVDNDPVRYPDDVFIRVLFEKAETHQILEALKRAINYVQKI